MVSILIIAVINLFYLPEELSNVEREGKLKTFGLIPVVRVREIDLRTKHRQQDGCVRKAD